MLHPDLYAFSTDFLAPRFADEDLNKVPIIELAEQIYSFPLFRPEFCAKLIEEVEHCGAWINEPTLETFPPAHIRANLSRRLNRPIQRPKRIEDPAEPNNILPLAFLPGLENVYLSIAERYLAPIVNRLWRTFEVEVFDHPYVLKYAEGLCVEMPLHHDEEMVALIVYLNDTYEGGGTYFPRWRFSTGKLPAGHAILYPGGISHEHSGLPVLSGTRYLFLAAFF